MGKAKKEGPIETRQHTSDKWGGTPSEFPVSSLPSYSDIARYYYHVQNQKNSVDLVTDELINRWQSACPSLPLRPRKNLRAKVTNFKNLVVRTNASKLKGVQKANLDREKNFLFEIAYCKCDLPILPCTDERIKCSEANCTGEHIYCTCDIAEEYKVIFNNSTS